MQNATWNINRTNEKNPNPPAYLEDLDYDEELRERTRSDDAEAMAQRLKRMRTADKLTSSEKRLIQENLEMIRNLKKSQAELNKLRVQSGEEPVKMIDDETGQTLDEVEGEIIAAGRRFGMFKPEKPQQSEIHGATEGMRKILDKQREESSNDFKAKYQKYHVGNGEEYNKNLPAWEDIKAVRVVPKSFDQIHHKDLRWSDVPTDRRLGNVPSWGERKNMRTDIVGKDKNDAKIIGKLRSPIQLGGE